MTVVKKQKHLQVIKCHPLAMYQYCKHSAEILYLRGTTKYSKLSTVYAKKEINSYRPFGQIAASGGLNVG